MAATDASPFPTKNKTFRLYFAIRDTSNQPITTTWTSPQCGVVLDGTTSSTATVVQVTGSHWGYVELSAAQMNGSAVSVSVSVTNANSVPVDLVVYPHDLTHVNTNIPPTSVDAMIRQIWERMYGKVVNTGDYLRVMGPDGVTAFASMPITASPLTKEKSYS